MSTSIRRTITAAALMIGTSLCVVPAQAWEDSSMLMPGGPRGDQMHRSEHQGFGGGGVALGAGLAAGFLISHSYMEDSNSGYREDCYHIGNCHVHVLSGPANPPRIEILPRKLAPKPIRHWTDKRTGWTYYVSLDRNTGEKFVQIDDANGNRVNTGAPGGQVQLSDGQVYTIR